MKACSICNKELLVYWDTEGEEACDDCFLHPVENISPTHYWGDDWFLENGRDLADAERYIWNFVNKWAKCCLISKEKYGTLRYERILPPRWTWKYNWIYLKWRSVGIKAFRIAIRKAIKKYPTVAPEILDDYEDSLDCL